MELEYITFQEALEVTGLSEKTLRDHLRGKVTPFGRNSWDRKEFFDYWRQHFQSKQNSNNIKKEKLYELLDIIKK